MGSLDLGTQLQNRVATTLLITPATTVNSSESKGYLISKGKLDLVGIEEPQEVLVDIIERMMESSRMTLFWSIEAPDLDLVKHSEAPDNI
ncbi:hypothetical protein JHK85_006507 [Glycine max]|nr:hypothetical protein JHK85_006507 [Glycine max]KAH1068601.1 hypothetical protein GYH30_006257 [Glycine max]